MPINLAVPLDEYVVMEPALALGSDAVFRLPQRVTGIYSTPTVDASSWPIGIDASFSPSGPPDATLTAGISVAWSGTNVLIVTVLAAATSSLTVARTIYSEVWRLQSGNRYPLRRLMIPTYDPERDA